MRSLVLATILAVLVPLGAHAQTKLTVDPAALTNGFMNVSNLPAPDGDGAFQFAQAWGFADLTAVFNGDELTLGPTPIETADSFWYQGTPGPGAAGNKFMEANSYAEFSDGSLAGQTVTFRFEVLANTLTPEHGVRAFIRDFAPDFSSVVEEVIEVDAPGAYALQLATIDDGARPVQIGFQMRGPNVWPTDAPDFGTIVIGPRTTVSGDESSFGGIKALYEN